MKGYIQNKGWKTPQDLANSYLNLEKLRGVPEDRLLKLPESLDAPEARAVWERLGTPKEAKEYGLDPKEFGEHLAVDFHEIGLPKDMALKLVKKQAERAEAAKKAHEENVKAAVEQADLALKKEWGMAYEQNRNMVDIAARNLGISPDEIKAMGQTFGVEKAMKVLHKLGASTGEASFVQGQPASNGVLAPQQAMAKIKDLKSDSMFIEKLMKGDSEAKKTWQRVHEMAYPDVVRF